MAGWHTYWMLLIFLLPSATTGCQTGLQGAIDAVLSTYIGNEAIVEGEDAVTLQCLGEAIQHALVQPLAVTCSAGREGEQQLAMPCQQRRRLCAIADTFTSIWSRQPTHHSALHHVHWGADADCKETCSTAGSKMARQGVLEETCCYEGLLDLQGRSRMTS